MDIRLIDAGNVPYLRSQTIYHGLAYARQPDSPDTIVCATPESAYVCIGFHQDIEEELDVAYCDGRGLPILRRETGGGAVYLDSDQLFVQWIMGASSLPARVEQRFESFARPLVETWHAFGIEAEFRPVNDVHVRGRKISGTGAARIGNAEVLVGNFLFAFDHDVMAHVLRAPSATYRDQVGRSLRRYVTSMRAEGVGLPTRPAVVAAYREACETALGRRLVDGGLSAAELRHIEDADRRFLDEGFRRQPGGLRRAGVKIHEGVHVNETIARAAGVLLRATARLREGRFEEIELTAGGVAVPELAAGLRGIEAESGAVRRAVQRYREQPSAASGPAVEDWVHVILQLVVPKAHPATDP